ncbi:MAG TPA: alpha/beta hydrolase [Gemmatimonadaceae bacterium]
MYPKTRVAARTVHTAGLSFARGCATIGLAIMAATAPLPCQPKPDSSGFVTTADGARLYYAIYGSGRDTVIVPAAALLAGPLASLSELITLVFYDQRGRGRSDWISDPKRLTMADELRDIEAVRAALGVSKVGIVGFSYLGLVGALYAADHPDRVTRLAQLDPMPPDEATVSRYAPVEGRLRSDTAAAQLRRARAAASDTADLAAECRRWYAAYLPVYLGNPANASKVSTDFCENANESPSRFQWRVDKTMRSLPRRWDYTQKAIAIRAPTLVIQGDQDFAVSPDGARRWAEIIPNARLIMLSGAGHLAYIERSDRVLPALMRFFLGDWPPEAMQVRTSR